MVVQSMLRDFVILVHTPCLALKTERTALLLSEA